MGHNRGSNDEGDTTGRCSWRINSGLDYDGDNASVRDRGDSSGAAGDYCWSLCWIGGVLRPSASDEDVIRLADFRFWPKAVVMIPHDNENDRNGVGNMELHGVLQNGSA